MNADAMRSLPAMLIKLNGIGPEFAAVLWSEGFYRSFANRRQVAAYAGLAPTPWQSGSVAHEQGVSKAGNPRLRTTMLQLAWLWLRHQPQSALALWFHERVTRNGGRLRKTTIVALARKLLVALWKYVTAGVVIDGVVVRSAFVSARSRIVAFNSSSRQAATAASTRCSRHCVSAGPFRARRGRTRRVTILDKIGRAPPHRAGAAIQTRATPKTVRSTSRARLCGSPRRGSAEGENSGSDSIRKVSPNGGDLQCFLVHALLLPLR